MLLNFIGSPASGKTTVAAMTFAKLKENGTPCEFIAERARYYIAKQKSTNNKLVLTDEDQFKIMNDQYLHELYLSKSVGKNGVVVSDSSALNGLLYLSEKATKDLETGQCGDGKFFERIKSMVDLWFYCPPVDLRGTQQDPNRLHTREQSLEADTKIPDLLKKYNINAITLYGNQFARYNDVIREVYGRLLSQ